MTLSPQTRFIIKLRADAVSRARRRVGRRWVGRDTRDVSFFRGTGARRQPQLFALTLRHFGESEMTFVEAAIEVLKREGKPLTTRRLAELAVKHNLLSVIGRDPEGTMQARLEE